MFAVLASLLLAASPAPGAAPAAVLSTDAEARWVPFTLTETNQIRFTASIDDRAVTAILDTGVSYSVLSERYAGAARIKRRRIGQATAIGGAVDLGWANVGRIAIGGLSRASGGLAVAVLPTNVTGARVDLLVGRDLTGGHALDIDYAARRFRLIPSGRLPFQGVSAPLAIGGARTLYLTEITLGGARLRPVVVDTGDGASITVTSAAWQAARLTGVPTSSAVHIGIAGPATSRIGIVPEVSIGPMAARNVEMLIEPPGGFSDTIQAAGRIGSGFLRNYRVLLDPGAGRMVLRAGSDAGRAPDRSTSGLILTAEPDRLRVVHVMAGSPAANGEWRTGDAICRVDGVAVAAGYAARWQVGAPGRTIDLGLCDGGDRRLTLRSFY